MRHEKSLLDTPMTTRTHEETVETRSRPSPDELLEVAAEVYGYEFGNVLLPENVRLRSDVHLLLKGKNRENGNARNIQPNNYILDFDFACSGWLIHQLKCLSRPQNT